MTYIFKICGNPTTIQTKKQSAKSAFLSYVNYVKQSAYTHNPTYAPMCLKKLNTILANHMTIIINYLQ
jgi:hypothetical protein